jgi:D-amino peptidase
MSDVCAVLDGAFGAGCEEAVVYDDHADGRNLDLDALDARAAVISGRPEPRGDFFYGLDDSFCALFLVGYRARAESAGALLPQTYAEDIACLRVNESELGEIGVEAALAGKFGVPLAFVSGDAAVVGEARQLLGDDVEAVEVKRAITGTAGMLLPASRTSRVLRAAAARAMAKTRTLPPVVFQSPTTLEVVFNRSESADAIQGRPEVERVGEFTVRTRGPSILEAYRAFVAARAAVRAAEDLDL